jgi:hypothetical protein
MPMTSSATNQPGSTSTPGPSSTSTSLPAAPVQVITRLAVRTRARPLIATLQRAQDKVTLPNGQLVLVYPGDYVISAGEQIIDVAGAKAFPERYEPIIDGLALPRSLCTQIEDTTGIGSTQTAEALLAAITRLAALSIGEVKIAFTPGQLAELKHRASKRGYTIEQELARVVDRIKDEIFFRS